MKKKLIFIGDVVRRLSIHEQTIRDYEKKGYLRLQRTDKNTRIFTESDITTINTIITLTQEMGLNHSGVRFIFALAKEYKINEEELLDFIYEHKKDFVSF